MAASLGVVAVARADEPPAEETPAHARVYSGYERQSIDDALRRLGARIDTTPQGKVVESIEIMPLEVVEPRDPIPNVLALPRILNFLHVTTKPYVIRREVLLHPGERYRQALVDETCRNLRSLQQTSLVLCFPVEGSAPDRARVVVVTKDVWSLRLNSDVRFANGRIERLVLQPTEANLLGTHQSVAALFQLDPATYSLGARYKIPRLAGSRVLASAEASFIRNRDTGDAEGSFGQFSYGQPLYSTQAEWSWLASLQWRHDVSRRFVAGQLATFGGPEAGSAGIPYRYREDLVSGYYEVTRSFGTRTKHDLSVGAMADRRVFRTFDEDLAGKPASAVSAFLSRAVPVSDTKVGPFFEYHAYSARYMRVLDLNTLGLQEDYRIGPEVILRLFPSAHVLGSSRDVVGLYASAAYTVPLGDGLARGFVETQTDFELDGRVGSVVSDGSVLVGGRVATPSTPAGRLIFDARMLDRYEDYLNQNTVLGGDTRLRGYPTQAFIGRNLVVGNLEYRTPALEVLSVEVGGAAFFDTGDVFEDFSQMRLKQGAGFGLRALIPMLDRVVLRADWGFPLSSWYVPPVKSSFPGEIVVSFRQAFPQPSIPTSNE